MPFKIPVYQSTEQIRVTPPANIPGRDYTDPMAGALRTAGNALTSTGQTLSAIDQRRKQMQDEDDRAKAKAANLKFEEEVHALNWDQQNGYFNSRGEGAFTGYEDYDKKLKEIKTRHGQGLQGKASEYYEYAAQPSVLSYSEAASRHASAERNKYNDQTDEATLGLNVQKSVLNRQSPQVVDELVQKSDAVIDERAARNRISPEVASFQKAAQRESIYANVINAYLGDNDPEAAKALYDAKKDQLPNHGATLGARIEEADVTARGQKIYEDFKIKYGFDQKFTAADEEKAVATIEDQNKGRVQEKAVQLVRAYFENGRKVRKENIESLGAQIHAVAIDPNISPEERQSQVAQLAVKYQALDPDGAPKLLAPIYKELYGAGYQSETTAYKTAVTAATAPTSNQPIAEAQKKLDAAKLAVADAMKQKLSAEKIADLQNKLDAMGKEVDRMKAQEKSERKAAEKESAEERRLRLAEEKQKRDDDVANEAVRLREEIDLANRGLAPKLTENAVVARMRTAGASVAEVNGVLGYHRQGGNVKGLSQDVVTKHMEFYTEKNLKSDKSYNKILDGAYNWIKNNLPANMEVTDDYVKGRVNEYLQMQVKDNDSWFGKDIGTLLETIQGESDVDFEDFEFDEPPATLRQTLEPQARAAIEEYNKSLKPGAQPLDPNDPEDVQAVMLKLWKVQ